jgi:hypothetical protein
VQNIDNPVGIQQVLTHSLMEGRLAVRLRSEIYPLSASVSMSFQLPADLRIPSLERVTSSGLGALASFSIRSSRKSSQFFSRRIGLAAASVRSFARSLPSGTLIFFVGSFAIYSPPHTLNSVSSPIGRRSGKIKVANAGERLSPPHGSTVTERLHFPGTLSCV